jgi:hypothetical protein
MPIELQVIIGLAFSLMGLFLGSFSNVLVYRLSEHKSLFKPSRSYCPTCGNQIKWYDNIAIISYSILRGKCRKCKEKISIRYPLIELVGLLLGIGFFMLNYWPIASKNPISNTPIGFEMVFRWQTVVYFFMSIILFNIALIDFKTYEIPFELSIPFILCCIGLFVGKAIENPNWDLINAYWTQIDNDTAAYKRGEIAQDEFESKYPIGGRMIIHVTLNGVEQIVDVEIIGYNHDNLAEGSGKAVLTFFCKTLPDNIRMNICNDNNKFGWEGCVMREFVNGDLYNALPDSLKSAIKLVRKISDGGATNRKLIYTHDKCWLASHEEVGLPAKSSFVLGQGELYSSTFSNNDKSRIKYLSDGYTADRWWLRSSDDSLFCRITTSGGNYGDTLTFVYPVAFGFCV